MPKVSIETVAVGPVQTNCYLVENQETHQLLVIDPGDESALLLSRIGERKPVAVLLTHGHFDHIGAVDQICGQFHIPAYIHEEDADKLQDPVGNAGASFGAQVTVQTTPTLLHDGQELTLGGMTLRVLHTPGHSRGSCCYLLGEDVIFCGDTLFDGGYGRTDFADGDFLQLKESLRTLMHLSPRRRAYPGHGGPTFAGRDPEAKA